MLSKIPEVGQFVWQAKPCVKKFEVIRRVTDRNTDSLYVGSFDGNACEMKRISLKQDSTAGWYDTEKEAYQARVWEAQGNLQREAQFFDKHFNS